MKELTDAEIKAANLKHALFLKAQVNNSTVVADYVGFLDKVAN